VLAPKPHQETVEDINDFVWRMCVSYRGLNAITLPFEYPIPRCDDALDNFGDSFGPLFFLSLDARSGYHQINVNPADRQKLAFFGPDGRKWTFNIMPFGVRNGPAVYTSMMRVLESEWEELYLLKKAAQTNTTTSHHGTKTIVDDLLVWSTTIADLLLKLECILIICIKYRLSLKLSKCDFLKRRFEFVGHDIQPDGNSPAQSKFDLINDWPLPTTVQSLHSFTSLCNFYHKFVPWFEKAARPFRLIIKNLARNARLDHTIWTPDLIDTFHTMKVSITSSPCLARYDSTKPCCLKTDWSANGMCWILMQPDNSSASITAMATWHDTSVCSFDSTMGGARLQPLRMGSRQGEEKERCMHSFVGEAACARWAISQNRRYLWGTYFFWSVIAVPSRKF